MMNEAKIILIRLRNLLEGIKRAIEDCLTEEQRRYLCSSSKLVEREHGKLAQAIQAENDVTIAWSLRSIADMMKGLIDIGSDLPTLAPALWQEAKDIANDSHQIERNARGE